MLGRRDFIKAAGGLALTIPLQLGASTEPQPRRVLVNDVSSGLNPTWVDCVERPRSLEAVQEFVTFAGREGKAISVSGGRLAMGGQQFGGGALHLDMRGLNRVLAFDRAAGTIEVESGIDWRGVHQFLLGAQSSGGRAWTVAQRQFGTDRATVGGALSANIHGRGLSMRPFIDDIESFVIVDADGDAKNCSRRVNSELFALAIGGYGLFGVVTSTKLRLAPLGKADRLGEAMSATAVADAFDSRVGAGCTRGDFRFCADNRSPEFMRWGVLRCEKPADFGSLAPESESFEWAHPLGREAENTTVRAEVFVPRDELAGFMAEAREDFLENKVALDSGVIRLTERDEESFLAWARQPYACADFALRASPTPLGLRNAADAVRRLIAMSIRRGGGYYLAHHKFASPKQTLACYPRFPEFLKLKRRYDPAGRFTSDWHRHYEKMFA